MSLGKWFYANVIVKSLDLLTTFYLVHMYGIEMETQPFTADMIHTYGLGLGLSLNGIIHLMLISLLFKFEKKNLLKIAAALTALFPIINFITILIETIGRMQ